MRDTFTRFGNRKGQTKVDSVVKNKTKHKPACPAVCSVVKYSGRDESKKQISQKNSEALVSVTEEYVERFVEAKTNKQKRPYTRTHSDIGLVK